jgi:hypothetical protein
MLDRVKRKYDSEFGALSKPRLDLNITSHCPCKVPADGKSEPNSLKIELSVQHDLGKCSKNLAKLGRFDASASVLHRYADLLILNLSDNFNIALLGILDGVRDQVDYYLLDAIRVNFDLLGLVY